MALKAAARVWLEIDLGVLQANFRRIARAVAPCQVIGVLKANAYGLGALPIARALHQVGCQRFGVAELNEGFGLADIGADVQLLGAVLPDEIEQAVLAGIVLPVGDLATARQISEAAVRLGRRARAHFLVDTGMGRVGVWWEEAEEELLAIPPGVRIHSLSTHLPSSDDDEVFTARQLSDFERLAESLRPLAPGAKIHELNSAGIMRFPHHAADIVRAGLILYGSSPLPEVARLCCPALTWKTRVSLVRDLPAGTGVGYGRTFLTLHPMRTAVLAAGYADGYPRQVSGRGAAVLVGGKKCAVLGRVTMDQIVVDVTSVHDAQPGDEAVLIGRQGTEQITAEELASQADTIPWHIFTGIKSRVARVYGDDRQQKPGL